MEISGERESERESTAKAIHRKEHNQIRGEYAFTYLALLAVQVSQSRVNINNWTPASIPVFWLKAARTVVRVKVAKYNFTGSDMVVKITSSDGF